MAYPIRLIVATLACLLTASAARAVVTFPDDANVANVRDYGAMGDGVTDDTAAFQKVFAEQPRNRLIYVPDGTYVISDTVRWGKRQTRQILQGQSRDGTIIKLPDNAEKFQDPTNPRAMFWTGEAPAQRFRNGVRDLTLDVGSNNPGAIGLQFIANNQGCLINLKITTSDPGCRGHIGLDMGYTGEIGPLLMRDVLIEGFDIGVFSKHGVNSITGERVTLRDQREIGWLNEGQVVSLRHFTSENRVPAFVNAKGSGLLAIIDSQLTGGDNKVAAIENAAGLFARNITTAGYGQLVDNTAGTGRGLAGSDVDEFTSHTPLTLYDVASPTSLNLPVRESPVIEWHDHDEWVSVADYPTQEVDIEVDGGKVETFTDHAPALQAAIDSGAKTVYFPHRTEGVYRLLSDVVVRGNVERIIGLESEVRGTHGHQNALTTMTLIFGNEKPVVFERFAPMYTGIQFRLEGPGDVVLRHLTMNEYNGIVKMPGSGDLFIDDMAAGGTLDIRGGNVFARQMNREGMNQQVKIRNDGGNLWILGYKTEGDSLLLDTKNGGRTEVVGSFVYANKARDPDKVMFRVDETSSMSFTVGEAVLRNQPFAVIEQWRDGKPKRLENADAHRRGQGSLVPLFVARPDDAESAGSSKDTP